MTEMIERAARALCRFTWERQFEGQYIDAMIEVEWPNHTDAARVVIEAMREPTEQMATHPMATCYNSGEYGDKEVRRIWRSMIGAALSPSPQEGAVPHD